MNKVVEVLDEWFGNGNSATAKHEVDYSAQKEYIHKLMQARRCTEDFDMLCVAPHIENDCNFTVGADNDPITDAYNKSVHRNMEYFVLLVSTKGGKQNNNIPLNIMDSIRSLVANGYLQTVLCTDGNYSDGSHGLRSRVDFYYVFSLRKKTLSVRFVDVFSPVKELKPVYEKVGCEDIYDNSSRCHLGFGRVIDVDYQDIYENDLILNSIFYRLLQNEAKKVTKDDNFIRIMDIISISQYGIPYIPNVKKWDKIENFSDNIGSVLTHEPMDMTESDKDPNSIEIGFLLPVDSVAINPIRSNCHFMWNSTEEPIFIVGADFLQKSQKVITYNKDIVDGAYITQLLMRSLTDRKSESLSAYLASLLSMGSYLSVVEAESLRVAIPKSIEVQKRIAGSVVEEYKSYVEQEQKAERERLGILDASADIAHMLGTTFSRQAGIMLNLRRKIANGQPVDSEKVKKLMDTVDYVTRFIKNYCGNFEDAEFKLREVDILSFINTYCEEWKNSLGERFDIVIKNDILDNNIVSIDTRYLKVAFDSLFDNAYRHGFDKVSSLDNKVIISFSLVRYRNNNFVRIAVLNNGKPFADDFSLEVFKSRGRYTAKSGHTGLGGNHIYQIVHGHNGFLALNNSQGLTGFDILLPVNKEISNTEYIYNYDKETI